MESLNLELLPDEAKKSLIDYYNSLITKYSEKGKTSNKLPDGFYNPIEVESYSFIARREEIYDR